MKDYEIKINFPLYLLRLNKLKILKRKSILTKLTEFGSRCRCYQQRHESNFGPHLLFIVLRFFEFLLDKRLATDCRWFNVRMQVRYTCSSPLLCAWITSKNVRTPSGKAIGCKEPVIVISSPLFFMIRVKKWGKSFKRLQKIENHVLFLFFVSTFFSF